MNGIRAIKLQRKGRYVDFEPTRDDPPFHRRHIIGRAGNVGISLVVPAISGAQQRPPIVEKLAKTYGLGSFGQVEAIRYTFNAQLPGIDVSRS